MIPGWGLGEVAWGFALAQLCGLTIGVALITVAGPEPGRTDLTALPLWALLLQSPPLWIGFIAAPLWGSFRYGAGPVRDFALKVRRSDVLPAAAAGVFAQLVLVPAVSWPFIKMAGASSDELSESARLLADKAETPWGVAMLVVVVVIGAPLAEELFFRGLLLGAIAKRWSMTAAVVGSAAVFGATHFNPLLFPALATAGLVFALLVVRTGRLGPAVIAHMTFNATTVVALLLR